MPRRRWQRFKRGERILYRDEYTINPKLWMPGRIIKSDHYTCPGDYSSGAVVVIELDDKSHPRYVCRAHTHTIKKDRDRQ